MPTQVHGGPHHYPGVWSMEGWAQRRAKKQGIGMDMVTTDEGAIEGDYLYTNTFFANGGHERPSYIAKETHLSPDLVPLAPPPGPAPQRSPSLSPPRQISAASEAFNWNKAATLSTSASLSSLPVMPRTLGEPGERFAGKQFSPIAPRSQGIPLVAYSSERRLQLDNEDAWTRRLQVDAGHVHREVQHV